MGKNPSPAGNSKPDKRRAPRLKIAKYAVKRNFNSRFGFRSERKRGCAALGGIQTEATGRIVEKILSRGGCKGSRPGKKYGEDKCLAISLNQAG
jgi:hypothetical protein